MNRLQFARSPYLLQHRANPVDWYPWGEEAFAEAARRDVPIFLSVGYATCHWCHVMERESFEDDEVAAVLNEHMVAIKVDREERPDIDDVYMAVTHLMGKQGGWPLTVIMTPDREPFYTATYLPKESRFGRIGMMELIPRVAELWAGNRTAVLESAGEVVRILTEGSRGSDTGGAAADDPAASDALQLESSAAAIDPDWLAQARRDLAQRYDPTYGGFGSAPKFPSPHNLSFLARLSEEGDELAGDMVVETIRKMWRAGVYDQVGYGLHRYSTDSEWRLPHFEKMLYDQATFLDACTDGWLATGDPDLEAAARQTAEYVLRDLTHPDGGFFSAEDADSEGEEGRFYVWSLTELQEVLGAERAADAADWFGATAAGNYLEEATRERTGSNVLHPGLGTVPPEGLLKMVADLRTHRDARVRPLRDEKVLTDWNGLMVAALARCGTVLGDPSLVEAAVQAGQFLRTQLLGEEWLHRWFEGDAAVPAMLDDYAAAGRGFLELFLATSDPAWLSLAREAADRMIAACDAENGGFYKASTLGEELLVRRQEWYDGAAPAGVSVALGLLLRLSRVTGETSYEERAARLVQAGQAVLKASPAALTGFLASASVLWAKGPEVIVVAESTADPLLRLARQLTPLSGFVLHIHPDKRDLLAQYVPGVAGMAPGSDSAAVYVCEGFRCELPAFNEADLRARLDRA